MLKILRKNKVRVCRILLSIVVLSLSQSTLIAADYDFINEPGIYDKIANLYLPTLIDTEKNEEKSKNEILGKNEIPPMSLGSVEALRSVYSIFSAPEMMDLNGDTCKKQLLDDCVFNDLGIFKNKLFEKIDFTKTPFGKARLQGLFYKKFNNTEDCTNDVKQLQRRVKFLVENEALYKQIDEKLTAMKDFFGELLWLWKPQDEVGKAFFDQVYFSKVNFSLGDFKKEFDLTDQNKNKAVLASSFAYSTWGALYVISIYYAIRLFFDREASMTHAFDNQCYRTAKIKYLGGDQEWQKYARSPKADYSELAAEQDEDKDLLFDKRVKIYQEELAYKNKKSTPPKTGTITNSLDLGWNKFMYHFSQFEYYWNVSYVPLLIAFGCLGLHLYSSYKYDQSSKKVFNVIHNKMLKVAKFADYSGEFKKFLSGSDELSKMLDSHARYKKMFMSDREFKQLDQLLSHFMQTDKCRNPSFLMGKGKVLAKFKDLMRLKSGLMADFLLIGEIDMLMSIAKLYKTYANHPDSKFCFAEFIEADKPYINIQKFWHLALNPDKAVSNSVELGTDAAGHNILLSGPNAAGKSSTIEGVALSIIMAMTMGVAPAASMVLTPFTRICSHLNVSYVVGKESLFQAEMNRAKNFLDEVKELKAGEFEFVIMDELFSSTNPEEGMAGAFGIMKSLVNYPNCMGIITTHFKKLQELESITKGYFRNYKVYVDLLGNGKFRSTYKMVPGISDQSMALLLMNDRGFDKQVVKDAFGALSEVKQDKQSIIVPEGFAY